MLGQDRSPSVRSRSTTFALNSKRLDYERLDSVMLGNCDVIWENLSHVAKGETAK